MPHGLILRGGFAISPDDEVPAFGGDFQPRNLLLIGNAGADFFPAFSAAPEASDGGADPIDRWTRRILSNLASEFGGRALFPFGGPPYFPFGRWAQKAEPVNPSPLGILIHPRFGLWHAYRGALVFDQVIDLPPREDSESPCTSCADKPCLSVCPVGAFQPGAYDVARCVAHIARPVGEVCLSQGCLARRACPVGVEYRYSAAQAFLHMSAFLKARCRDEEHSSGKRVTSGG